MALYRHLKYNDNNLSSDIRQAAGEIYLYHIICRLAPNGFIAGGALRSRIAKDGESDFDCYFTCGSDLENAKNKILADEEFNASIKLEDDNVIMIDTTLGKVDLVKRYFPNASGLLDSFDFTVCCFALDCKGYVTYLIEGFQHLRDKKLVLHRPSCPGGTQLRLQKYAQKGYLMDIEEHEKLIKLLQTKDISKTFSRLKERGHAYNNNKPLHSGEDPFTDAFGDNIISIKKPLLDVDAGVKFTITAVQGQK
jgi:hypothetical protein